MGVCNKIVDLLGDCDVESVEQAAAVGGRGELGCSLQFGEDAWIYSLLISHEFWKELERGQGADLE